MQDVASLSGRLFDYSAKLHSHRHGPSGYKNYEEYKPWLRDEFRFTCVYCLVRERWQRGGHRHFSVEHIIPRVVDSNRIVDYNNLIYACVDCNSLRQDRAVLDPFSDAFVAHLHIDAEGIITGLTSAGVAHIKILLLDSEELTQYRRKMIQTVRLIEENTHADAQVLLRQWLGFPDDLPNLDAKRPPGGNTAPLAVKSCYFEQRKRGILPDYY